MKKKIYLTPACRCHYCKVDRLIWALLPPFRNLMEEKYGVGPVRRSLPLRPKL